MEAIIQRLKAAIEEGKEAKKKSYDQKLFRSWSDKTEVLLRYIYKGRDKKEEHVREYLNSLTSFVGIVSVGWGKPNPPTNYSEKYDAGIAVLDKFIYELELEKDNIPVGEQKRYAGNQENWQIILERHLERFHKFADQLQYRHDNRTTITFENEYDVQDALRAVLWLDFDDVREEDYCPQYGGKASRTDFVLKKEKCIIEVKMPRNKNHSDKPIGDELMIDIQRYSTYPDCDWLYFFIYDPNKNIKNPQALINDLSGKHDKLWVKVIINQ